MSDQCPLLCEDFSEERFNPHFRRLHMSRIRARNNVKGAAAIITRWPEHWSSLLTYWWTGIAMIVLSTFIIYNFIFAYASVQSPQNLFSLKSLHAKSLKPTTKEIQKPQVFMHIFLDKTQELDLDTYLPYIEIVSQNYTQFQYEIIVIANDTNPDTSTLDDDVNDQALNTILTGDFKFKHITSNHGNLHIKYTTLSQYLRDSPLRKYWKSLPYQFTKLLVRAISIWEKGGIAFDPILLTHQSPHPFYKNKIIDILSKFDLRKEKPKPTKINKNNSQKKVRPKVNNIRDIIDALSSESENTKDKTYQDSLEEAETKTNTVVSKIRHLLMAKPDKNLYLDKTILDDDELIKSESKEVNVGIPRKPESQLLSLFMNYLFHNDKTKPNIETPKSESTKTTIEATTPKLQSKRYRTTIDSKTDQKTELKEMETFRSTLTRTLHEDQKPVIISAKGIFETTNVIEPLDNENLFEVTLDLKGNIIGTDTACHAFIGGMFSNAVHHDRSETVTDFIIKELSIFCKGLLASCVGIDVILL